jgi:heterodisulfide reductase subunit A-like polyferredoxin
LPVTITTRGLTFSATCEAPIDISSPVDAAVGAETAATVILGAMLVTQIRKAYSEE